MAELENQALMATENSVRGKSTMVAVNVGLIANMFLAVIKTTIGIMGHSPALLADGINSTSDVAYGLVVAIFMRLSRKPADREHPFGHSQFESIAALVVGAFVMTTAVGIFWDAINTIFDELSGQVVSSKASPITLWVALFTVGLKIGLFYYTRLIGKKQNSIAVTALAYDHRNDIFAASAALVGIALGRAGLSWVDPLAAAIVALVILRTGIQILRESASDLMDTLPEDDFERRVSAVLKDIPGILKLETVLVHRFGPYMVMNITINVDGAITVAEGDQIANEAEKRLRDSIDFLQTVHIHYHPIQ
ncbi:MAG: cation diffusion facilitator family transporter [bacterium]|jgi:cation diffusion facilitator family transporter